MGSEIGRRNFSASDYQRFGEQLQADVGTLRQLLETPGWGGGERSIGAELEMYLIDPSGHPLGCNSELQARSGDPQLTLELNRYNIEYNLTPCAMQAQPLLHSEREILLKLGELNRLAAEFDGRVVPIGILPTLKQSDFGIDSMTDLQRYHALVEQLIQRRGRQFDIHINGDDPLQLAMKDITLEGANTSFQLHIRVPPDEFVNTYNAMQIAAPLAIALAGNSPTLFGHRLWQETRIPLFKQSIDTRVRDRYQWHQPARVSFGHGWLRHSPLELFAECATLYPPLLPVVDDDVTPEQLAALRLHLSTVWMWNRPVYDPVDGGHLRIEMRALPAGPSAIDMIANAALMLGLGAAFRDQMDELIPALPFQLAEYNFYRAAQHGLSAKLVWPFRGQTGLGEYPVKDLILQFLPDARDGLQQLGISATEIQRYLDVIEQRVTTGQNGADWQLQQLAALERDHPRDQALATMLNQYVQHCFDNIPVSQWPVCGNTVI